MCPESGHNTGRQRGFGLIAAIFTITAVALMAVMVTRMVRTGADGMSRDVLSARAFAAAESGAHLALNRLFAPVGTGTCGAMTVDLASVGLNRCQASTSCSLETVGGDNWYSITSTGTCDVGSDIASRQVLVRAKP